MLQITTLVEASDTLFPRYQLVSKGRNITTNYMEKERLHSLAMFLLYNEGREYYHCKEDVEDHMAVYDTNNNQLTCHLYHAEMKELGLYIMQSLRFSYKELLTNIQGCIQDCHEESDPSYIHDMELCMLESGAILGAHRRWPGTIVEFHISEFTNANTLADRLYYLLTNQQISKDVIETKKRNIKKAASE